ncbi:MAG: FHA domain-containing protein [Alphaproteobacteria bacterium]|nr:FHA domain-containing protein [Alphaproteobacteria bacterium]
MHKEEDDIKKLEALLEEAKRKLAERQKKEDKEKYEQYMREAEQAREQRKNDYFRANSEPLPTNHLTVKATTDDLPVVTTSDYHRFDFNNIKKEIENMPPDSNIINLLFTKDGVRKTYGNDNHCQLPPSGEHLIVRVGKNKEISFSLPGGKVEFANGSKVVQHSWGLSVESNKESAFSQKERPQEERMEKNKLVQIDKDNLPLLNLAGVEKLDLKTYKDKIAALGSGQQLMVGRSEGSDIRTSGNMRISRHHCTITNINGKFYLSDISTNGTSIVERPNQNGEKPKLKDRLMNLFTNNKRDGK